MLPAHREYISVFPESRVTKTGLYAAPHKTSMEGRKMDSCGKRLRIALMTLAITVGLNAVAVVSGVAERTYGYLLGTGASTPLEGAAERPSGPVELPGAFRSLVQSDRCYGKKVLRSRRQYEHFKQQGRDCYSHQRYLG